MKLYNYTHKYLLCRKQKNMFFYMKKPLYQDLDLLVTFPPSSVTYAFPCHLLDQTHPLLHQSFFGRNHIHLCLCLKIRKQKKWYSDVNFGTYSTPRLIFEVLSRHKEKVYI